MLITIYFRESPTGGLHTAQDVGATVLRPFQVGAERVAQPFRDVYGWFAELFDAKAENERLRREHVEARQRAIQNATAVRGERRAERRSRLPPPRPRSRDDYTRRRRRRSTHPAAPSSPRASSSRPARTTAFDVTTPS